MVPSNDSPSANAETEKTSSGSGEQMPVTVPDTAAVTSQEKVSEQEATVVANASAVDLYPPINGEAARSPATPARKTRAMLGRKRKTPEAVTPPTEVPPPAEAPAALQCSSAYGWVELNGNRYDYDVIVHVDGTVTQRDKSISRKKKEKYGHTPLTGKELLLLKAEGPEMIIIGTGHNGAMPLTPKAETLLDEHEFFVGNTQRALMELAISQKKTVALLHVTC